MAISTVSCRQSRRRTSPTVLVSRPYRATHDRRIAADRGQGRAGASRLCLYRLPTTPHQRHVSRTVVDETGRSEPVVISVGVPDTYLFGPTSRRSLQPSRNRGIARRPFTVCGTGSACPSPTEVPL